MSGFLLDEYPAGSTIYCLFDSFAGSTGAPATISGFAVSDVEIYKNGSTTQRSSDAGYALLDTDGIDFDSITGINGFSVDLSDNTDSGFYAAGAQYTIVISTITVDSQTVSFVVGTFHIMAAEATAGVPAVNTTHAAGTAWGSGAITAASIASDALTAAKLAADVTTELQSGLATSAALTTLSGLVDDLEGRLTATRAGYLDNLGAALAESYAAVGAEGTIAQLLYEIRALLAEKAVAGTTLTTKKLDGSTTAATYTLDDDTAPTAITRAT